MVMAMIWWTTNRITWLEGKKCVREKLEKIGMEIVGAFGRTFLVCMLMFPVRT